MAREVESSALIDQRLHVKSRFHSTTLSRRVVFISCQYHQAQQILTVWFTLPFLDLIFARLDDLCEPLIELLLLSCNLEISWCWKTAASIRGCQNGVKMRISLRKMIHQWLEITPTVKNYRSCWLFLCFFKKIEPPILLILTTPKVNKLIKELRLSRWFLCHKHLTYLSDVNNTPNFSWKSMRKIKMYITCRLIETSAT